MISFKSRFAVSSHLFTESLVTCLVLFFSGILFFPRANGIARFPLNLLLLSTEVGFISSTNFPSFRNFNENPVVLELILPPSRRSLGGNQFFMSSTHLIFFVGFAFSQRNLFYLLRVVPSEGVTPSFFLRYLTSMIRRKPTLRLILPPSRCLLGGSYAIMFPLHLSLEN